jgi:hypothetical protein
MSYPKGLKASRRFLKSFLATTFCACLLGIVFLDAGICQTPGYGDKPDQWAPYERGKYFEQLQKIVDTYRFDGSKITYLHFEETDIGVGPVDYSVFPTSRAGIATKKIVIFLCSLRPTTATHRL